MCGQDWSSGCQWGLWLGLVNSACDTTVPEKSPSPLSLPSSLFHFLPLPSSLMSTYFPSTEAMPLRNSLVYRYLASELLALTPVPTPKGAQRVVDAPGLGLVLLNDRGVGRGRVNLLFPGCEEVRYRPALPVVRLGETSPQPFRTPSARRTRAQIF